MHALPNKLSLHYQPLFDVANEKLIGAEALLRWHNPLLGFVGPDQFIPVAEMTLVNVGDSEVLPSLLNPLRRRISEVSGDGAYDTKECHKALKKKDKTTYPTTKKCWIVGTWTSGKRSCNSIQSGRTDTVES